MDEILNLAEEKMERALVAFETEIMKISIGRPNPNIFNEVVVDYYGTPTPLPQTSNIKIIDASTIIIVPFDRNLVKEITNAISISSLEFHPQNEGDKVRINIPVITEERRTQLSKKVNEKSEEFKIGVRHARQEAIKKIRGYDESTEDSVKDFEKMVQEATDKFVKKIEESKKQKQTALLKV